jgi:putative ABC transport system ATP-binding protein
VGEPLVRVRDLVRLHGPAGRERRVLDGVDLDVQAGELLAIVGPSGSGKSTLLAMLGGLDRPSSGSVTVAGRRIDTAAERALAQYRRDMVGFVFQDFHLVPELSVRENVLMPARLAGRMRAAARVADELLERLGLAPLATRLPGGLSGGEQQRVAIARALVLAPVLVLADEPTGNLDSASGETVLELLQQAAGPERAVVLVTHEERATRIASRTVTLADGRLAA